MDRLLSPGLLGRLAIVKRFPCFAAPARTLLLIALVACSGERERAEPSAALPTIVLVTLDTVRADALGHEGGRAETPVLDAIAAKGVRFAQAYTSAPTTLPAHTSMLTGLHPAAHGVHENGRRPSANLELLAERLKKKGYQTAAFVSGFPLARRFGLDRGFDRYDDDFGDAVERSAAETTDRVLSFVRQPTDRPLFLWVHYYDAHEPYSPPEPFATRWSESPYFGEVAYVDSQLGRLIEEIWPTGAVGEPGARPVLLVAGDHGEGLGDHGELRHGNLLYQGVMRVPLLVSAPGLEARTVATPVSTRRIFETVLELSGEPSSASLFDQIPEVVVAEAMKPFLQYGWQPQVMAVSGRTKAIRSGSTLEVYDVISDPGEVDDLASERRLEPAIIEALRTYPLPSALDAADSTSVVTLDQEGRRKLAALGYVASTEVPVHRSDAPNARDMTHLFGDLDRGSGLFVQERWQEAISVFDKIARQDPDNLMVNLRLAVAYSLSGREDVAERYFDIAERIIPESFDGRRYRALHDCRFGRFDRAETLLEPLLPQLDGNVAALECLSEIRLQQGRFAEAARTLARVAELEPSSAAVQRRLGEALMAHAETAGAIAAFEAARRLEPESFDRHLELGVLYLAVRRLDEAGEALDSVPPSDRSYPMALFKRAQVSVLRGDADRVERVRLAHRHADATTRSLIASESLFRGISLN